MLKFVETHWFVAVNGKKQLFIDLKIMYKFDSTFTSHALYSIRQDGIKFSCSSIFTFYTFYCEFSKIIKLFTVLVSSKPLTDRFICLSICSFLFICLFLSIQIFFIYLHFFSVKMKSIRITLLIHCNMLLDICRVWTVDL